MTKKGAVDWCISFNTVTSSIARSPKRRYLSNSEAEVEVFRHAWATRCTDGGELSIGCKKTATENGSLQLEIEINEYSSSKIILE